jgi:Tfp pilus assembly protein PilF
MTAHVTLAISAALDAGQLSEAERLCRAALQIHPQDERLLLFLAVSLQWQKRLDEAVAAYARLIDLFPTSSVHWNNYGAALHANGAHDEAQAAFAKAIDLDPANAGPRVSLGLLLLDRRQPAAARDTLLEAVRLDPNLPMVRIHAARACNFCRDNAAEELLKDWQHWLPLDESLQLALAYEKLTLGDARAAQTLLEDLYRRAPDSSEVILQLASVYERVNRVNDARALLHRVEMLSMPDERVRLELAHQHATLALRDGDLARARDLLDEAGPRAVTDYVHYFLLGKICDKQKDTHAAMQALEIAHRLQIEEIELARPERVEAGAPVLPAAIGRVTDAEYGNWPQLIAPGAQQSPIFIVGFPRSGTTLLEQMLDAHPGLQSMDERPFFNILADQLAEQGILVPQDIGRLSQPDCDELRRRYLALVCAKIDRQWIAQLVDKNPLNMLWVPFIHRLFPQAKFILALRHPCDVLLSCYMQNFRSGVLVAASASLERLAEAYVTAMRSWLRHVEVFQPRVLVSRYEDLVADVSAHSRRIAEFLELEDATPLERFDERAREKGYIATPSYTQVIEPVNRKGLNRWQRYRREFEPVLPILAPMLNHWGYATEAEG